MRDVQSVPLFSSHIMHISISFLGDYKPLHIECEDIHKGRRELLKRCDIPEVRDSFKRISGEFARSQACSSLAVNTSTYCVGIFDYKRDNWLDSITEKIPLHPLLKYYV